MKNKELKVLWTATKSIWIASFIFWILETLIFLIIEGWHLKATNPIEICFDNAVGYSWNAALYFTGYICINYIINLNKKRS